MNCKSTLKNPKAMLRFRRLYSLNKKRGLLLRLFVNFGRHFKDLFMTIIEIQDQVIAEFALLEDWTDKYEYIIELGKGLKPLPEKDKIEDNIIKGCQSLVWLVSRIENGKIHFQADSDAIIVKGLVSLLIRVLSGHSPSEIANADLYFIEKIGMTKHLAQTRSNGLLSMVKQMKFYGLAYQLKETN